MYNSLNKKIIPKLDDELILNKDVIKPNNTLSNIGKFTNLNNYNDHIRLDSDSESDISYIPTNNSFSSLSELDLQWDDEVECSEVNNDFWTKDCPKSKYENRKNKKYKLLK